MYPRSRADPIPPPLSLQLQRRADPGRLHGKRNAPAARNANLTCTCAHGIEDELKLRIDQRNSAGKGSQDCLAGGGEASRRPFPFPALEGIGGIDKGRSKHEAVHPSAMFEKEIPAAVGDARFFAAALHAHKWKKQQE